MKKEELKQLKEMGAELDVISNFITNWIDKNQYNGNLAEQNEKFNKEFKSFFDAANFKHEKIGFWCKSF